MTDDREPRGPGRKPDPAEFQALVSVTISTPMAALWDAWHRPGPRHLWLHAPGVSVRRSTPQKAMVLIWKDGSNVRVTFTGQAAGRCLVTVRHEGLRSESRAAELGEFWNEALGRLRRRLERR